LRKVKPAAGFFRPTDEQDPHRDTRSRAAHRTYYISGKCPNFGACLKVHFLSASGQITSYIYLKKGLGGSKTKGGANRTRPREALGMARTRQQAPPSTKREGRAKTEKLASSGMQSVKDTNTTSSARIWTNVGKQKWATSRA